MHYFHYIIVILLINSFSLYAQDSTSLKTDARFNESGYSTSASSMLDGKEIVSDYDGNFSMQFSTSFGSENLKEDFTILLNNNVQHVTFSPTTMGTVRESYSMNIPEWILGFGGFAVQMLNFEVNTKFAQKYSLMDCEVPTLVPGYHYSRCRMFNTNGYKPEDIEILRADGSKIVLISVGAGVDTGVYCEKGITNLSYAYVTKGATTRNIYYKPGNGKTYLFVEEDGNYTDQDPGYFKTTYLTKIYDNRDTINLYYDYYTDSPYNIHQSFGRKVLLRMDFSNNSFFIDYTFLNMSTGEYELKLITLKNYLNNEQYRLYIDNNSSLPTFTNSRTSSYNRTKIYQISRIEDLLKRGTNINYTSIRRIFTEEGKFNLEIPIYRPTMIRYYNGKKTELSYIDNNNKITYDYSPRLCPQLNNYFGWSSMESIYRDKYSNHMLSARKVTFPYAGIGNTINETYTYLWDKGSQDLCNSYRENVHGIKTIIQKNISNETSTTKLEKVFEIKRFFESPPINFDESDQSSKTLLVYDNVWENNDLKISNKIDYDPITFLPVKTTTNYFDNTIPITKVDSNYYQYDSLYYNHVPKRTIEIKKAIQPDGLIQETIYNTNLFPSSHNDINYSFISNLIDSQKIYNADKVKESVKYIYNDNPFYPEFFGKLKEERLYKGTINIKNTYDYYVRNNDNYLNKYYYGLLKSKTFDNGLKEEYEYIPIKYSDPYNIKYSFYDSIVVRKVYIDGTESNFPYKIDGFNDKPYKIRSIAGSDTTIKYYEYDFNRLTGFVDENKFLYEYDYDLVNRIVDIRKPGSFSKGNSTVTDTNLVFYDSLIYNKGYHFTIFDGKATPENYNGVRSSTKNLPMNLGDTVNTNNEGDIQYFSEDISEEMEFDITPDVPDYDYHIYFQNPIISSSIGNIHNAQLNLKCSGQVLSANETNDIRIFAITSADGYESNYLCQIGFRSYTNLLVDLTSYLQTLINQGKVIYGIKLSTLTINTVGPGREKRFNFDLPNTILILSHSKKVLVTKSLAATSFKYDDYKNTAEKRELIDSINGNYIFRTSKVFLDPNGSIRKTDVENETKSITNYNYLFGKPKEVFDGENIKETFQYDFLGRVKKNIHADNKFIENFYCWNSGSIGSSSYFEYQRIIDENNIESRIYFDILGNKVAESKYIQVQNTRLVQYKYDGLSRLTEVLSPLGKSTKYIYNANGFLESKISPDEGTNKFKYDKYGNLRYAINTGRSPLKVNYYKYDKLNRITHKGEFNISTMTDWNNLNPDITAPSETDNTLLVVNEYEKPDRTIYPFQSVLQLTNNVLKNLKGRLVATAFRDKITESWNYKLYSYTPLGNVATFILRKGSAVKSITNTYNKVGLLTSQILPNEDYRYYYYYDKQGRLDSILSGRSNNFTTDEKYTYFKNNKLKSKQNCTGLTNYQYNTPRGWLTGINNVYLQQNLGYDFIGNVNYQELYHSNTYHENSFNNYYNYDSFNQLIEFYSESYYDNQPQYEMITFGYDNDGNIDNKYYNYEQEINYNYVEGTNKLLNVEKFNGDIINYTYDSNGLFITKSNITSNYNLSVLENNSNNLPLKVNFNGTVYNYMYDDNGQRIQKKSGSTGDFYLRDHTGRELAVYDTAFTNIKLINLYGADGMIGKVDVSFQYIPHVHPQDGEIYYEVIRSDYKSFYNKDHLGSIRQTVGSDGTVSATYDYSPFGEIISSYVSNGSDKYKFTQKERDTETNLDYFGARYYDSEIGRWLSPDPLADKYPGWSPYNYCLNNPINLVDPDGNAPGTWYLDIHSAALDWARYYNGTSIIYNKELGSKIYREKGSDGKYYYTYTEAIVGKRSSVNYSSVKVPENAEIVAFIHSHGSYDPNFENNNFSTDGGDLELYINNLVDGFVVTPNGSLLWYVRGKNEILDLLRALPHIDSDPKDPNRRNNNPPQDRRNKKEKQKQDPLLRKIEIDEMEEIELKNQPWKL